MSADINAELKLLSFSFFAVKNLFFLNDRMQTNIGRGLHCATFAFPVCALVEYSIFHPAIYRVYVSSPLANPENPLITDEVLKRLCMLLYTLKYASQKHILKTALLIKTVIM